MREEESTSVNSLPARVSRANLLKAAGAGLAIAAVPGVAATSPAYGAGSASTFSFPYFPNVAGTYTTESIQDILNAVITTRYLVADAVYFLLTHGSFPAPVVASFQIGLARFQYEIDFLASLGAEPLTTTATLSPAVIQSPAVLPKVQLATAVVTTSMFITATREFAELGQPVLAKWMAQLAAREAESVGTARVAAGNPSLPSAFETELFLYTRDGLAALKGLGLYGGSGPAVSYPGRNAILAAAGPAIAIIQRTPNNASSSITVSGIGDLDKILGERN